MKQTIGKFNNNALTTNKNYKSSNNKNDLKIHDLKPRQGQPKQGYKLRQKYEHGQLHKYKQHKNNTKFKSISKKQKAQEKQEQQLYRQLQQRQSSLQHNHQQEPKSHSFSFFGHAIQGKKINTINSIVNSYLVSDDIKYQNQQQQLQRKRFRKISNPQIDDEKQINQFLPYRSSYLAKTGMQPIQRNQCKRDQTSNNLALSLSLDIKKAACLYHTTPNFKFPGSQKPPVIIPPPEYPFITHNQFLSHSYYSNDKHTRSLIINHKNNSKNSYLNKSKAKNSIQVTLHKKNFVKLLYAALGTVDLQRSDGCGGILFGTQVSSNAGGSLNISRKNSNTLNMSRNKKKQLSIIHPRMKIHSKTAEKGVSKGRTDQGHLNPSGMPMSPPKVHLLLHMKRRLYNRRRSCTEPMQKQY